MNWPWSKKKDEPEPDTLTEEERQKLEDDLKKLEDEVERREDLTREKDLGLATTLVEAKQQLLQLDKESAKVKAELIALSQLAKKGYIIAVITTKLPGGRRRSIAIVNVDITGKKVAKGKKLYGPKTVGLTEGLLFSVNERMYELDSEYVHWEIPNPTIFYDRDKTEPIHFYEREVSWKGAMISTIDMLGHFSLRIEKLIQQRIIEIAARERPEEAKVPFTRLVVIVIAVMTFLLGVLIGKFGF